MTSQTGSPTGNVPGTVRRGSSPRPTLTGWLRGLPDAALGDLIARRPDLGTPPPADIDVLATRLRVRVSVVRALERLDTFSLEVCEALILLGDGDPVDLAELLRFSGVAEATLTPALARLRGLALVWGDDDDLRLVGVVTDLLGERPLGLGRPLRACLDHHMPTQLARLATAVGVPAGPDRVNDRRALLDDLVAALADPDRIHGLIASCSDPARRILTRLAAGPALGVTGDAQRLPTTSVTRTPVEELLARGLLVGIDGQTVELPREVGLVVRGDRPAGELHPVPPALTGREIGQDRLDGSVAQSAGEAVRLIVALVDAVGAEPLVPLRAGGLSVRDLRALARRIDVTEQVAALLVELAYAAGLIDQTPGLDVTIVPTTVYDRWMTDEPAGRWATLASVWLDSPRLPGLVGDRDEKGRPTAALSLGVQRGTAPDVRRAVLATIAEAPAGLAPDRPSVRARMAWKAPRWGGPLFDRMIDWTIDEAETLGVLGRGGMGSPGRALLSAPRDAVAAILEPLLPEPVEQILVQADLTAVAPGPLVPRIAAELSLMADVESSGAATVYRISEATVRRALDNGRTADDLHTFLAGVARGGVPQTLDYLIDDVGRRHGQLRSGPAASYLRCDDPALLAEVVASRRTQSLGLRRIAPTVVISSAPPAEVLMSLRAAGYAPAAEAPDGRILIARPAATRTPGRPRPSRADMFGVRPESVRDLVRLLRRGDEISRAAREASAGNPASGAAQSAQAILVALSDAVRKGRRVVLAYVDQQGTPSDSIVVPLAVEGGFLTARDERDGTPRRFALHRITTAAELDP